MTAALLNTSFTLAPAEAMKFFNAKGLSAQFDWHGLLAEEHNDAFMVAKMMDLDLLADTKAVIKALQATGKLGDAESALEKMWKARGWWGSTEMLNPKTGELQKARIGSPARLQLVIDTNMRTAAAQGYHQSVERRKAERPYLAYSSILDGRTRKLHRQWHGLVLRVDDPWWETHYPPNGYGCRCRVISLTEAQARAMGKTKPDTAPANDGYYEWKNPDTGIVEIIPNGVDPGWNYHAGRDRSARLAALLRQKIKAA